MDGIRLILCSFLAGARGGGWYSGKRNARCRRICFSACTSNDVTGINDGSGLFLKIISNESCRPSVWSILQSKRGAEPITPRGCRANGCSQPPLHTTSRWNERSVSLPFVIRPHSFPARGKKKNLLIIYPAHKLYWHAHKKEHSCDFTAAHQELVSQTPVVISLIRSWQRHNEVQSTLRQCGARQLLICGPSGLRCLRRSFCFVIWSICQQYLLFLEGYVQISNLYSGVFFMQQ